MFRVLFEYFRKGIRSENEDFKVAVAILAILCYSASGYMFFEIEAKPDLTWADAFWWSVVTMTTVGYGDFFPETNYGRFLVGLPTMIFGISILGYLLSAVATRLIEAKSKELKGMKQIKEHNHILLVHFSDLEWVVQLIDELRTDPATAEKAIVLIDNDLDELPPQLDERGIRYVRGHPARKHTLEKANCEEATHAIILSKDRKDPRSDDLALAVAMSIEALHPDVHTVAEAVQPESIEILRRTGCDSVVCASKLSTALLVQELIDPGVQQVVAELTSVRKGQQIYVLAITAMKDWSLEELQTWLSERSLLLIGLKRGRHILLNPDEDTELTERDAAIFIGSVRPATVDTTI